VPNSEEENKSVVLVPDIPPAVVETNDVSTSMMVKYSPLDWHGSHVQKTQRLKTPSGERERGGGSVEGCGEEQVVSPHSLAEFWGKLWRFFWGLRGRFFLCVCVCVCVCCGVCFVLCCVLCGVFAFRVHPDTQASVRTQRPTTKSIVAVCMRDLDIPHRLRLHCTTHPSSC
jgi:hypothetical protein